MVLPVSGFLPVPLPMMIPFMGAQSLVIGKMFGEGFQYGKRKISAMPNEEFNKLTFEDMMSNARTEMQASIPTMQKALQDMQPMVTTVVKEFLAYIELVAGVVTGTGGNKPPFHDVGEAAGQELDRLLEQLRSQFPSLPEASGTPSGSGVSFPLGSTEDTHEKRVEIQRLQTLQNKRQQDLIKAKIAAEERKQIRGITPQFGQVEQARLAAGRKRLAGQSQKIEKNRLTHLIKIFVDRLRQSGVSTFQKDKWTRQLREHRQLLANLLARYQF